MVLDLVESGLGREFNITGKEECIFQIDGFISGWFGPTETCGTLDSHRPLDTQRNSLQGLDTSKWAKHLQGGSSHTRHSCARPFCPLATCGFALSHCWGEIFQAGTVQMNTHTPGRQLWWR